MNLVPTLATGYDQVSDTEYRIHLREGVKFHDGHPSMPTQWSIP